jgi:hypothetical protein
MEDHIHILSDLHPSVSLSDYVKKNMNVPQSLRFIGGYYEKQGISYEEYGKKESRMRPELNHPCIALFPVLLQPENTYIPRRQKRIPPRNRPQTFAKVGGLPATPRRLSPKSAASAQLSADFR